MSKGSSGPAIMSRFAFTSLLAIVAFFAIGLSLKGGTQLLAFTGLWLVYLTLFGLGIAFIQMKFFCRAICRGATGRKQVSLTFDDGPDPATTIALLDLLREESISAGFFCIGKRVAAHPQIMARIAAEGHLIGNHTYNHFWWTALMFRPGLTREISQTQEAIKQATGSTPVYMRPPVGMTNPHYPAVLRRAGMKMIGWDVRSMDTRWSPQEVIDHVLRRARDGSIILLHDGSISREGLLEIVKALIAGLRQRGFSFERVDRLIEPGM